MTPHKDFEKTVTGLTVIHHNAPLTTYVEHSHSFCEGIIPLFGSIVFHWENKKTELLPGRMLLMPADFKHSAVSPDSQGERLVFLIENDSLRLAAPANLPRSQLIVELCFEFLQSDDKQTQLLCRDLFLKVTADLVQKAPNSPAVRTRSLLAQATDPRVKRCLAIFEEDPGRSFKMNEVAKASGMSERTMQRLFRTELHMKPHTALTLYRIDKAIELLCTGASVTTAGFAVGFDSLSQFIAQFRTVTGRLPSDYLR